MHKSLMLTVFDTELMACAVANYSNRILLSLFSTCSCAVKQAEI